MAQWVKDRTAAAWVNAEGQVLFPGLGQWGKDSGLAQLLPQIQSLAGELPNAEGVAIKKERKSTNCKENNC